MVGTAAVAGLSGNSPAGAPMEVALEGGRRVLLFLTSSCHGCRPLWRGAAHKAGGRVILVTPSPSTESAWDVAGLAPAGCEVLMSSEAWHAFGVTAAPWLAVVADGCIVAEGPAPATWEQVEALAGGPA
jgi:hypothetical protein